MRIDKDVRQASQPEDSKQLQASTVDFVKGG